MKTFTIAAAAVAVAALSALAAPSISLAADSSVAFNAGVVTDYRYRGISQSRLKPALQAVEGLGHFEDLLAMVEESATAGAQAGVLHLQVHRA